MLASTQPNARGVAVCPHFDRYCICPCPLLTLAQVLLAPTQMTYCLLQRACGDSGLRPWAAPCSARAPLCCCPAGGPPGCRRPAPRPTPAAPMTGSSCAPPSALRGRAGPADRTGTCNQLYRRRTLRVKQAGGDPVTRTGTALRKEQGPPCSGAPKVLERSPSSWCVY